MFLDVESKVNVIKSFAQEIITPEELKILFETNNHPVAYDGFEPSGQIHLPQGILRAINVNKLTTIGVKFKFLVADWFGMMNNKFGGDIDRIEVVGKYFIEVWKACGLDMKNVEFIWTSKFINEHPEYWKTVLKLSMNASVQRVLRCGQIMGREDSVSNPSAQIFYPIMQCADMAHLNVDIAQLGLDQRKVNMLAREIFPKIGLTPPIAVHHKMIMGLTHLDSTLEGVDRKIAMKMSKSKPETAIFMTDSKEQIYQKFKNAYCPEGIEIDNPVLEYAKEIVFEKFDRIDIQRPAKFGGDVSINNYGELREIYIAKKLHPMDLKNTIAEYVDQLVKPVREHFENNSKAHELYEQVRSFSVTR